MLEVLDYIIRKITLFLLGTAFAILIGIFMYYYLTHGLNNAFQNLIHNVGK